MAEDKLEVIDPPNVLNYKVGTDGPEAIDEEPLAKAEEVIASLRKSPWPV